MRFAMRRAFFLTLLVLGVPAATFGQAAPSDSQTLQSLLTEVRALRQELRVSLARVETSQILLSRLQMQEGSVARASVQLNEARSKLLDVQVERKQLTAEVKRLEDTTGADNDPQRQKDLQDRISHVKSDLEVSGHVEQERQRTEIQAEQLLRAEQDKLSALEAQLDELIRNIGSQVEQSGHNRP
jgi:septal ring factor EnvC (AmiA/AmiB activator)